MSNNTTVFWFVLGLISAILLTAACKQQPPQESETEETVAAKPGPSLLVAVVSDLRVRDAAGLQSTEIERVAEGDTLVFQGELSNFTTKMKLRGVDYDEPWLKISTPSGKEGWVYAAAVRFDAQDPNNQLLTNAIINKRLETFFGQPLVRRIEVHQALAKSATSPALVADLYRDAMRLKTDLNDKLDASAMPDQNQMPNWFWIENALPGFKMSLVAEGTLYQLFVSFDEFARMARQTTGNEDDAFFVFCKYLHNDAWDYYFAVWFLQTWDYGGSSLLGEGKHRTTFDKMNALPDATKKIFAPELKKFAHWTLADILEGDSYWNDQPSILTELDQIIAANYLFFTADQQKSLKARREVFKNWANSASNPLKINVREDMN